MAFTNTLHIPHLDVTIKIGDTVRYRHNSSSKYCQGKIKTIAVCVLKCLNCETGGSLRFEKPGLIPCLNSNLVSLEILNKERDIVNKAVLV